MRDKDLKYQLRKLDFNFFFRFSLVEFAMQKASLRWNVADVVARVL